MRRKHPLAKVGDKFGAWTVVRLLPRARTSNERVLARCSCGVERPHYVFNLRQAPPECSHGVQGQGRKLPRAVVRAIVSAKGAQLAIAVEHGISQSTVSRIRRAARR